MHRFWSVRDWNAGREAENLGVPGSLLRRGAIREKQARLQALPTLATVATQRPAQLHVVCPVLATYAWPPAPAAEDYIPPTLTNTA